jgi:hypothetical protein
MSNQIEVLSRRAWLELAALAAAAWWSPNARAGKIVYSGIDRATVRVITLSGVELEPVPKGVDIEKGHRFAFATGGHGTGVLVSPDGLILTARHVIEKARTIVVRKPGSSVAYAATTVFSSKNLDYAFIAATGDHPEFLSVPKAPPDLAVRQTVHAVGYPLDATRDDPQSSQGIVSGELSDGSLQLDIAVNPGNSGGPLIDAKEQLVGIVVARARPELGIQGIGFAVPLGQILAGYTKVANEQRQIQARAALANDKAALGTAELLDALVRMEGSFFEGSSKRAKKNHAKATSRSVKVLSLIDAALEKVPSADTMALGCAVYWNDAIVAAKESRIGWRGALARALELANRAKEQDPTVEKRSPFVTYALYWGPQL